MVRACGYMRSQVPAEALVGSSFFCRASAGSSHLVLREAASPLGSHPTLSNEGQAIRDIRGDLQDRASLLEEQINAHEAEFEKLIEELKREHNSKLEDLKAELEAVTRLMEVELRRLSRPPAAPTAATNPRARAPCGASTAAALQCGSTAAAFGASTAAASSHQPPQHPVHQPPQHSAHHAAGHRRGQTAK